MDTKETKAPDYFRLQLIAFVCVSAFAVFAGINFNVEIEKYIPESQPVASIFNKRPSGLSGLFEVAQSVGLHCAAWSLPYRELSLESGMLVIIAPNESLKEFETEQILSWVKKGNSLLYLDKFDYKMFRRLLDKLNVEVADGTELIDSKIEVASQQKVLPEFAHVNKLKLSSDNRIKGGEPLLADKSGTLMSELTVGKGKIYLGTIPNLCANRRLADKEYWSNFQLLVNIFRTSSGGVLFDEYCHGYTDAGNVFAFLAARTPGLVFKQMLFILLLLVWSQSKRFGRVKKAETPRKISNLEYINGLANTYRRAHANAGVLEIIFQSFKTQVCKSAGLSPHEEDGKIIQHLKSGSATTSQNDQYIEQVSNVFSSAQEYLKNKHLTDKQLKAIIEECDKISTDSRQLK